MKYLTSIRSFFAPIAYADEEQSRKARILRSLIFNLGGALLFALTIGNLLIFVEKRVTSLALLLCLGALSAAFVIMRRNQIDRASAIVVAILWVVPIGLISVSGGLRSLDLILLVPGTVIAGLLIGRRGSTIYAVAALIAGLGFIALERLGVALPNIFPFPQGAVWVILLISLAVIVIPLDITLQSLSDSLDRSHLKLKEREHTETAAQRHAEEMKLLYDLSFSLASGKDLTGTLFALQQQITRLLPADAFYVAIYNPATDIVDYPIFFDKGQLTHSDPSRKLSDQPGLTGAVIYGGRTLYLADMMTHEVETTYAPVDTNALILHTFIGVPLIVDNAAIGVISIQSERIDAYTPDQIQLLEAIAPQAALAIDKARLLEQLQSQLMERKKAEQAILTLNSELEDRVEARTAELIATVNELESFSYTVGHDLRAPLRGIRGFSQIILRDYGDQLSADVIEKLKRIEESGQMMGDLIDAMLDFSRITRASINATVVNLSKLAQDEVDRLMDAKPDRVIEWEIEDNLIVHADRALMQVVIKNLIDNAFKFTSRTPDAKVSVGQMIRDNQVVYFVRDNGAGFDMQYAEKIFKPFHRMHHPDEFPGHGAGLTTTQRIIQRHGGKIWAEAKLNAGATFYFTLGSSFDAQ